MTTFGESVACRSRLHCETCRALTPEGEGWRRSVAAAFDLESGPGFACPIGRRWGWRPAWYRRVWRYWRRVWAPRSRGLGDTISKLTSSVGIPPCAGCKQRGEAANERVPYGSR